MADMATILTSISSLVVSVGALVVSVGIFYLVVRVGRTIETMAGLDENRRDRSSSD